MRIDCYGRMTESPTFAKGVPAEPLETRQAGGLTFARYGDGERCAIHRFDVDEEGIVRETWAYGAWADAETLAYVPVTETVEAEG